MKTQTIGIAWFRPDQWERLREVSADSVELEADHNDWLGHAEKTLFELHTQGMNVVRVDVDVEDLLHWCRTKQRPVNAESRSKYAAELLQLRDQQTGSIH